MRTGSACSSKTRSSSRLPRRSGRSCASLLRRSCSASMSTRQSDDSFWRHAREVVNAMVSLLYGRVGTGAALPAVVSSSEGGWPRRKCSVQHVVRKGSR